MKTTALILGASGRVGSRVVNYLDQAQGDLRVRLSSQSPETVEKWRSSGRDAELLDLNDPDTFARGLDGVDRVFLLTGYTADMLYQSKQFVDAAKSAGVSHIVHLGVFTSRNDRIPHFTWHDLIESYIESSGIAWTHLHPNVIAESILVREPSIAETGSFAVSWGDAQQGWVFAEDIAEVAAKVLQEGPEKHAGNDYWLSTEVLTASQVASTLTDAVGKPIQAHLGLPESLEAFVSGISDPGTRAYMQSAVITMQLAHAGQMQAQTVVRDDVQKVLGRPGMTVAEWGKRYLQG